MELKLAEKRDYPRLKELYCSAFPAEERAPFWLLKRRTKQGRADFWNLYDGETWTGLAYVLRYLDLVYVFYLAIDPNHRGRGCGTQTMEALKEHYAGCRLFLALETLDENAPNYDERVKRHRFYERCGLRDFPCRIKEASMVYSVMGIGEPVRVEDYGRMIHAFQGPVLRWLVDMRLLPNGGMRLFCSVVVYERTLFDSY